MTSMGKYDKNNTLEAIVAILLNTKICYRKAPI